MIVMFSFSSLLIRDPKPVHYTRAFTPVGSDVELGSKGPIPVIATVDGETFKSSLMPAGNGQHSLIVPGPIQKKINKKAGATVQVSIEIDLVPRDLALPEDFENALENNTLAKEYFFNVLSPSRRKGLAAYIDDAKTVETRLARIEKLCETLAELHRKGEKPGPSILYRES